MKDRIAIDNVIVVDPAMNSLIGHHHSWNTILQQGLDSRKLAHSFFFSNKFDLKNNPIYHDAYSVFTYNPRYDLSQTPETDPNERYLEISSDFVSELQKNISELLSANSLVFAHTITAPATLLGLARWYDSLPQSRRPHMVLNVHFLFSPPTFWALEGFRDAASLLENFPKIRVVTPLDSVVEMFHEISYLKVEKLPYPFDFIKKRQQVQFASLEDAKDLVFGFAGTAMPQKNIVILPEAIENYINCNGRGRFIIQMTQMPGVNQGIPAAINRLAELAAHHPEKITFIPEGIYPNEKYYELISRFSVALLLYDPKVFHKYRPSQVFSETACMGQPAIVCKGSWLELESEKLDNGSLSIEAPPSADLLASALFDFESSTKERTAKAIKVGSELRKINTEDNFFEMLLGETSNRRASMYEFNDEFLMNFTALGNTSASFDQCRSKRNLFVEPRLSYQLFSLRHPEYNYVRGYHQDIINNANKHFSPEEYALRVSKSFVKYPKYNFDRIKDTSTVKLKENSGILIATSIAPKRIEAQQKATSTWIKQGFQVISINYQHEIDEIQHLFPDVRFIPNKHDSLEEYGSRRVYLYDIFNAMKEFSPQFEVLGIVNSDIALYAINIEKLKKECHKYVVMSHRIDLPDKQVYVWGLDAFFMNRSALNVCCREQAGYLLGEPFWDYYYPLLLLASGYKVSKAVPPLCYHIQHDQAWQWEGWERLSHKFLAFFENNFLKLPALDIHKLDGVLNEKSEPHAVINLALSILLCQPDYSGVVYTAKGETMSSFENTSVKLKKTAAILGNGPSLRGFDFKNNLKNYTTFGMNAAYRYWDRINWYPDYYSCLDMVVGLSHQEEIARLIERADEYGIRSFLLRGNLVRALGTTGRNPKVIDFDKLRNQKHPFLASDRVTTGSHTMAWAAYLGYTEIVLLGIDANYVELVEGAKNVSGIVLEMTQDLSSNPNYFFDDYQRKGDQYNIPNPTSEPSKAVHLCSWREIQPVLNREGVYVVNANPTSMVDAFPKCSFAEAQDVIKKREFMPQAKKTNHYLTFYIVTPSYNSVEYIDETIQSIVSQNGTFSIRYHVQDGGSDDGTVKRLQEWEKILSSQHSPVRCKGGVTFTWDSSPDKGMYHAINKGFSSLNAPNYGVMAWCNADDKYLPNALATVCKTFVDVPSMLWMGGNILRSYGPDGQILGIHYHSMQPYPREMIRNYCCDNLCWNFLHQSSIFWRGSLWKQAGGLLEDLAYAGDYSLWARFAEHADFIHLAVPLSIFTHRDQQLSKQQDEHGASCYFKEMEKIAPLKNRIKAARNFWAKQAGEHPKGSYLSMTSKKTFVVFKTKLCIINKVRTLGQEQGFQLPRSNCATSCIDACAGALVGICTPTQDLLPANVNKKKFPNKLQKSLLKVYGIILKSFLKPKHYARFCYHTEDYFAKAKHPVLIILKKILTIFGPSPVK